MLETQISKSKEIKDTLDANKKRHKELSDLLDNLEREIALKQAERALKNLKNGK